MPYAALAEKLIAGAFGAALLSLALCPAAKAAAAPDPCTDVPVEVTGASAKEHPMICSGAKVAIGMLYRCGVSLRKPLQVHVMREVRHPLGGQIFGLFDTAQERVLVTESGNVPMLAEGTPYSALPPLEFHRSVIVHEVVHGILHQRYGRQPNTHAAYEYPAVRAAGRYLSPDAREEFLRAFDQLAIKANTVFSDTTWHSTHFSLLRAPISTSSRRRTDARTSAHCWRARPISSPAHDRSPERPALE